jgi:hypothetical protein
VVAQIDGTGLTAECKGGIINTRHSGQVSRLYKDKGLCETVGLLMANPSPGCQIAVVPRTEGTLKLAQRLAPKQLDFLFYRKPGTKRASTIKYLRGTSPLADRAALLKDMQKLSSTALGNLQGFEEVEGFKEPERFLLVVAQDSAFRRAAKLSASKNRSVAKLLRKALRDETPPAIYQTTTQTHLLENMHWIVAAFGESAWS